MGSVIFIFFLIVMIGSGIVSILVGKYTKSVDQKRESGSTGSLEHTSCDIDNSCFHEYAPVGDDEYTKVCKNCGHRNSKKDKRCSVCGKKLFF